MNERELSPRALGYRMPGEWEPHAATWLAWPHQASDWPGKFGAIPWVFTEIARHVTAGERVRLFVRDARALKEAQAALARSGVALTNVDFILARTDRSWTRDFVPSFVVQHGRKLRRSVSALSGAGRRSRSLETGARSGDGVAAIKWRFNGWARYKNHQRDEQAGRAVADVLEIPRFEPTAGEGPRPKRFVLEGGAIDVDGDGTLLTTEECLLDGRQARDPELGQDGVESILSDQLAIDKVIWLERGIAGDDTGGHVDDFARFARPGVIVLAEEKNKKDPNHRVLAAANDRLRGARDARGRRIEVVRLPMPAPVAFDGQRLPASYANFYIANAAVLVPTFNDPNDRRALGILSELFTDRPVIGVHALDFVLGLGTIHCSTQQEPL